MPLCGDIYLLQSYVDGQLSVNEAETVAAHLPGCPACARLVFELQLASAPLRLITEEMPAGLAERLHTAVRDLQPLPVMTCEEAQRWLSELIDGELSLEHTQQMQAHLDGCASCARFAAEVALSAHVLRHTEQETAPAGLLQRIETATQAAAPLATRRQPLLRRWVAAGGALAAAAALLLALAFNLHSGLAPTPGVAVVPQSTSVAPIVSAPSVPHSVPTTSPVLPSHTMATVAPATHTVRVARAPHPAALRPSSPPTAVAVLPPAPAVTRVHFPSSESTARVFTSNLPGAEGRRPVAVAPTPRHDVTALSDTPTPVAAVSVERPETPVPALSDPRPMRLAMAETGKIVPALEATPHPSSVKLRVSRVTSDEREVYTADDDGSTRLADARRTLESDARTIHRNLQTPGLLIH